MVSSLPSYFRTQLTTSTLFLTLALTALTRPAAASGKQLDIAASSSGSTAQPHPVEPKASGEDDRTAADLSTPQHGFEPGLRLGFGLPLGDADGGRDERGGKLGDIAEYRVPVWLDLNYRLGARWTVGIYGQVGLGSSGGSCPDKAECNWSDTRLGIQALYAIAPNGQLRPWLGAGLGYEWLKAQVTQTVTITRDGVETTVPISIKELLAGPQLLLQGGFSLDLGETVRLGPYASASLGQYLGDSFECPTAQGCPDEGIDEKRVHAWLSLGLRGTHGF